MNPDVASGRTRNVVGIQGLLVAPVHFSGFRVDLQAGFLADREPLLSLGFLVRGLLLDRNVRKQRFNDGLCFKASAPFGALFEFDQRGLSWRSRSTSE